MTDNAATVRAVDGRTLVYAEAGDPNGAPVFYFHGLPGSRSDFDRLGIPEALVDSGVRLIGVDRPGFGASDFQPGRRYDDWPADVATVADELGISRFAVLGRSSAPGHQSERRFDKHPWPSWPGLMVASVAW